MEKKEFWKSKSFWGIIIMAVSLYAPKYATQLQGSVDDVITLIGLVVTLIGRWHATQPLGVGKPSGTPVVLIPVLLLAMSIPALGQDTVKLSVSLANTDLSLDDVQGVQAELDAKIFKYEKIRIGGVFHYVRPQFNSQSPVDTYSAGPQLSYGIFGNHVELFGRALFGVSTDYNGGNRFTRTYGVGGDINLGHVFVRPFVIDFVRLEGFPTTINRYGAGAGIRF